MLMANFARFNLCNPCCSGCPQWGNSSGQTDYFFSCCSPSPPIASNMFYMTEALFTETLQTVTVFHMGPANACYWDSKPEYNSIISDWVAAGGRLIISGEYDTCLTATNLALLNQLCIDVGSSMSLNYDVLLSLDCLVFTPETIGLTATVSPISMGLAASINLGSGVAVAKHTYGGSPLKTFIAVEKVGAGAVLLSGDSNVFSGTCGNDCSLWRAFANMTIAEMY